MSETGKIVPVLLSGGTGSRLWPMSRNSMPKQFQALAGDASLIQQSALRACGDGFARTMVVANVEHRFIVAEQLREAGIEQPLIVLEPEGRNTAPAAAVAALLALRDDPDAIILLAPADHVIVDDQGFAAALRTALASARRGMLTLFGMQPDHPATGYGYIRTGEPLQQTPGAFRVAAFVEKPDDGTARSFMESGDYFWNSGIFLLPARGLVEELERHEPTILAACRAALDDATEDLDFLRLGAAFSSAPSISIDHAVMERTRAAAVVPAAFGWTDVGAWSALWDIGGRDGAGNVASGDVLVEDCRNSYVRSEGPLVAILGVDDLVVVATEDAVLVTRKDRAQDVKAVVERLKAQNHPAATQTRRVGRPWGFYQSVHDGERFQVKRITVNPGAKLSLQKHFHRAEHWVVVNGTALVTRDDEEILLRENESIFLPLGCVHRLENPGKLPLNLIEVQSGPYLGEDDIVRFEDVYQRA